MKPEYEITYQELCQLLAKNVGKVSALEALAIAANMVGKLMAMQDQRTVTTAMAIETVAHNMELGNQQVIDQLMHTKGNA